MTDTRDVLLKCRHSVLSMIRYDAAAGHVVFCWMSSFSAFNESGCTTVGSGVGSFFFVNFFFFLNLPVPDIAIARDWLLQHPSDQCTHAPKSAGNAFIHAYVFFLPHLYVFSVHYFVKLHPFRKSYPGSHGTHSSPFPTTERAFVLIASKKNVQN